MTILNNKPTALKRKMRKPMQLFPSKSLVSGKLIGLLLLIFLGLTVLFIWLAFRLVQFDSIRRNGTSQVPVLEQAKQIFGPANLFSSISYFDGRRGKPTWNSRVLLADRYELEITFPFEYSGFTITSFETPEIELAELDSISVMQKTPNSEQSVWVAYVQTNPIKITPSQWQRLVKSNGDFSQIGIDLDYDRPLENTRYLDWRKWRKAD
jgi:hypothetical protein